MTNSPIRRTRHNRVIGAIVASVSLLAVVFVAVPWVDEYFDLQRDAVELSNLELKLSETRGRQMMLDRVEQKLDAELERFVRNNADQDHVESIREAMIEIVRGAGARLRRLEISMNDKRAWATENDDARNDTMSIYATESTFVLHSLVVELQADGPLTAIRQVLRGVGRRGWLMTTNNASLTPTTMRESPMNLELRLVVFGLAPAQITDENPDDSNQGSVAGMSRSMTTR